MQTTDISSVCGDFLGLYVSVAPPYIRHDPERQACLSPIGFLSLSFSELPISGVSFSFIEKIQPPSPQTARSASSSTINLVVSAERLAGSKTGEL